MLKGFAHSSMPVFASLCHYQESMISSSLVKHNLHQDNLYKTLLSVLGDLEDKYNELLSRNRWLGIGTNAAPSMSSFLSNTDDDCTGSVVDKFDDYVVFTASTGQHVVPFETWVKDKIYHNCNKVGHVQWNCPKPLQSLPCSRTPKYHGSLSHTEIFKPPTEQHPPTSSKVDSNVDGYSLKVKALITAAHNLTAHVATAPLTDNEDNMSSAPEDVADYSDFLAALGCPKE